MFKLSKTLRLQPATLAPRLVAVLLCALAGSLIGIQPAFAQEGLSDPAPIGGDAERRVVTREQLEADRLARRVRAREKAPSRPTPETTWSSKVDALPDQAVRHWDESQVEEDADKVREMWRVLAQREGDAKRRAAEQLLALPGEDDQAPRTARKVASSSWEGIGIGIHVVGDEDLAGRIREARYVYADDLGYTTLYVASPGGGIFRYVGVGLFAVWVPLTDTLPTEPMVGSFVVDRTNSDRILLGTGDPSRGNGTGAWRTLDGGATWQSVGPFPVSRFTFRVAQDSTDPDVVLLAGASSLDPSSSEIAGIWRSEDFGTTWDHVYDGAVTDLVQDPAFPAFWLGGESGVGVIESSDGGETFAPVGGDGGTGLGGVLARRVSYAISESSPEYHYLVATDDTDGFHGIFRSTDYGHNWQRIDQGDRISWGQGWHTNAIGVDPEDRGVVFVGMGGNQWTDNADAPDPADICWRYPFTDVCAGTFFDAGHEDQTGFTFVPDAFSPGNTRVLITNDGGLFVYDWAANTIDGSANTRGLSVAQIWPDFRGNLAASSADPSFLLAGLYDNGVVRLDTDHAQKIRNVTGGGDGGHVDVSPDDASEWFYSVGLPWRRVFTTDALATSHLVTCGLAAGLAPTVRTDATPGFAHQVFTNDDRHLWWKPMTGDCDWQRINELGDPIGPSGALINSFDQANNPTRYIFYATRAWNPEVYVLEGGGFPIVPEVRTPPLPAGTASWATAFPDASSLQPRTVYYTTGEQTPGRAYLSTDAGLTWEDVTGDLETLFPDAQLWELVGDPRDLDRLFLATDVGVLRSDDRGRHWYRWMNGLPKVVNAMSLELVYDGAAEPFVVIGTFGRGFWRRTLDDSPIETALFADAFESGDTTRWSSASP